MDEKGKNISHLILKYYVHYGAECYEKKNEFRQFKMEIASSFVKRYLLDHVNDEELCGAAAKLRMMFLDGAT